MRNTILTVALTCGLTGFGAASAQADEVRLGLMLHDAEFFSEFLFFGIRGREQSSAISAEYVWDSPDWLAWAKSARPYIGGSRNLGGKTSHGGAGILWRLGFLGNFYGEFATGLVVHNGAIRTPSPRFAVDLADLTVRRRRRATEIQFGSRALFRNQLALGYKFNQKWAGEIVYEHLSHGKILGGPENQGTDSFGFRLARRF